MDLEHQDVTQKLIKITIMSFIFMGIELVGGYLANSIAIFADAFHLLSDVFAYLVSLGAVWLSTTPNPPKYLTFGWEKAQPLGVLVNVAIIYMVTAQLFVAATKRMINQEVVQNPFYMLITSIFGLGCNLIIIQILHSDPLGGHNCSGHGHDHGHGHGDHGHGHSHEQHDHGHQACSGHDHSHNNPSSSNSSSRNITHSLASPVQDKEKCKSHSHEHEHEHIDGGIVEINSGDDLNQAEKTQKKDSHSCEHNHSPSIDDDVNTQSIGSDEQMRVINERSKKMKNINLQAAYIHVLTDIILSIGVIISAVIIYFMSDQPVWTPWQLADPFCTYLFSFLAIYSTWPILKEAVLLLLDGAHDKELVAEVQKELNAVKEVKEISNLRIWSTNRDKNYGAVLVKLERGFSVERVRRVFQLRKIQSYVEVQCEEEGEAMLGLAEAESTSM